jgi:hypothetical protein
MGALGAFIVGDEGVAVVDAPPDPMHSKWYLFIRIPGPEILCTGDASSPRPRLAQSRTRPLSAVFFASSEATAVDDWHSFLMAIAGEAPDG